MRKKIALLCLVVFPGIFLSAGCTFDSEDTYTVWTTFSTYYEFQTNFYAALDDGEYLKVDWTNSQFAEISDFLDQQAIEYMHEWTQSEIKNWFIGCGFDNIIAEQESCWIATNYHGIIASRSGNTVYYIIK